LDNIFERVEVFVSVRYEELKSTMIR